MFMNLFVQFCRGHISPADIEEGKYVYVAVNGLGYQACAQEGG